MIGEGSLQATVELSRQSVYTGLRGLPLMLDVGTADQHLYADEKMCF